MEVLKIHYYLLFAFVVSFFLVLFGESGVLSAYKLSQEKMKLEKHIEFLEAENAKLTKNIKRMQTDPTFQEAMVREKLSYVQPDELIFEFPRYHENRNNRNRASRL